MLAFELVTDQIFTKAKEEKHFELFILALERS